MATGKPRVTVTLDPDVHAILRELSDLNGESMSRIIGDLVGAVVPTLQQLIEAGRAFRDLEQSVQDRIREKFEDAENRLLPEVEAMGGELLGLFDMVIEAGGDAADPRPVTRGSGPPSPPLPQGGAS